MAREKNNEMTMEPKESKEEKKHRKQKEKIENEKKKKKEAISQEKKTSKEEPKEIKIEEPSESSSSKEEHTQEEVAQNEQKEESIFEPTIIQVIEEDEELFLEEKTKKKICKKCKTENDADANFCKKCGTRLKYGRKGVILSFSKVFQIIAIAIAFDAVFQVRRHIGTAVGDSIVIEYAFLLFAALFLSTLFRLISNNVSYQSIKANKFRMSPETTKEMRLITAIFVLAVFLFIFSNSRIVFLKPGNNYIERKVGEHIQRWGEVDYYARMGVKKCPRVNWYWKYLPDYTFFCYEYTYYVKFQDGESCFIKYRSRHTAKVNQESFSYCNKK